MDRQCDIQLHYNDLMMYYFNVTIAKKEKSGRFGHQHSRFTGFPNMATC